MASWRLKEGGNAYGCVEHGALAEAGLDHVEHCGVRRDRPHPVVVHGQDLLSFGSDGDRQKKESTIHRCIAWGRGFEGRVAAYYF